MNMHRLELEYPLSARKPDLLWTLLSTDHGLNRWLADEVKESDGIMSFTWGKPWADHHTLQAYIVEREKNDHIRFKWVGETDQESYWEMRIGRSELTEELCLCVVDYATDGDVDDLHELWDDNLERLHQSSGF